jgi:threonine dehydrogenase-like Zn-dependent dehydrogenase
VGIGQAPDQTPADRAIPRCISAQMNAITFDIRPARIALAKVLGAFSPRVYVSGLGAVRYRKVADPRLPGDDWLLVEPRLAGICGSDVMQAFIKAAMDNPLSAVVTAPHVMGHEVVGTVIEAGPGVRQFRKGDRVAVNPWLPCAARGLPPCEACQRGDFPLCAHFFEGRLASGMHLGNCRDVGGGFAEVMALHESMLIRIPESVPFDLAVMADPFAVSLHAVLRAPPQPGETVLVYGCGSLGLMTVHLLSVLFPGTRILVIDHKPRLRPIVERLGGHVLFTSRGADLIGEIGNEAKSAVRRPLFGLPWLQGGIDRIYDTIGQPESLELGVRVIRPRGSIVMVGVAKPRRFEWTPLYFKEVSLLGSNAYGVETFEGRRANGIEIYLDLLARGRLKLDGLVTHRYPLSRFTDAFMAIYDKRGSGAIKVLFDPKLQVPDIVPGARA